MRLFEVWGWGSERSGERSPGPRAMFGKHLLLGEEEAEPLKEAVKECFLTLLPNMRFSHSVSSLRASGSFVSGGVGSNRGARGSFWMGTGELGQTQRCGPIFRHLESSPCTWLSESPPRLRCPWWISSSKMGETLPACLPTSSCSLFLPLPLLSHLLSAPSFSP